MTGGGARRTRLVALESSLLDHVQAAVLVMDLSGVIVFANPYCETLYGHHPDTLIGESGLKFSYPVKPELMAEIGEAILAGQNWEGEFRVTREDGSTVDVHAVDAPVFTDTGAVDGVISLAIDVTAQRLSHDELRRVLAVAQILRDIGTTLLSELDTSTVMKTTIAAARNLTDSTMGAFLAIDPDEPDGYLFVRAGSGRVRESSLGVSVPIDTPLLAAALAHDGPYRVDDTLLHDGYADTLDLLMPSIVQPLRSCIVMAVHAREGDVAGVLAVAHTDANRYSDTEENLLADIGAQAGIVLDIARLFRAAEQEIEARRRAEQVQRFYAETSAVLSLSLQYPEAFEQLGRLCVPFLADLCLIDVAEEHSVRRFAAIHADPERAALVAELEEKYPPDAFGSHPALRIARGGKPEVAATLSDRYLRDATRDEHHFAIVKELDFRSYMCVPLEARGRVLGALTLVSSGSGRHFGEADLALAVEFARRAGLALDNARLYSERDHVARALQSSLLPPSLPAIPGVEVTARYRAAGEGNEVGGDFYHVFQVDERSWWFAIGDVSGKGPEAAAIAGLSRHTLRALGFHERSPSRLLTQLHETLLAGEAHGEFCTVACALLQPHGDGATLSIACGGHPPPIVRRHDGRVEVANCSGPLLGMPVDLDFVEQSLELGPGDIVVLYTDGVTEAHHRNQPLFGEDRLVEVIGRAENDVQRVADDILMAVTDYGPAEPRDDVAVVVVRIDS